MAPTLAREAPHASNLQSPISNLLSLVSPGSPAPDHAPDTDWAALVALAERHGLAPLLHARLAAVLDEVPEAARAVLTQARTESAAKTMFFEWEAERVVREFREADIPLIVFKGIPLARLLFGDPALRPTLDLDVMVREADLPRARALLEAAGWQPQHRWHIHDDFVKEVGGAPVILELHWTSQREGEFHLSAERLWQEAREEPEGWSFSREMLLLILVLHTARHFFTPYRQLADIAHAVAQWNATLDWPRVVALADEAGARPVLATVLALVHRDLQAPLPRHGALARHIRSPRIRWTLRYLSPEHLLGKRWLPVLDKYWVPAISGAWQPIRLLLGDMIRTPEQIAYIYKLPRRSPRILLFYLLRPFLLARKYLRHLRSR